MRGELGEVILVVQRWSGPELSMRREAGSCCWASVPSEMLSHNTSKQAIFIFHSTKSELRQQSTIRKETGQERVEKHPREQHQWDCRRLMWPSEKTQRKQRFRQPKIKQVLMQVPAYKLVWTGHLGRSPIQRISIQFLSYSFVKVHCTADKYRTWQNSMLCKQCTSNRNGACYGLTQK